LDIQANLPTRRTVVSVHTTRKTEDNKPAEPEPHELEMLMVDSERLQERRQRLSSIS